MGNNEVKNAKPTITQRVTELYANGDPSLEDEYDVLRVACQDPEVAKLLESINQQRLASCPPLDLSMDFDELAKVCARAARPNIIVNCALAMGNANVSRVIGYWPVAAVILIAVLCLGVTTGALSWNPAFLGIMTCIFLTIVLCSTRAWRDGRSAADLGAKVRQPERFVPGKTAFVLPARRAHEDRDASKTTMLVEVRRNIITTCLQPSEEEIGEFDAARRDQIVELFDGVRHGLTDLSGPIGVFCLQDEQEETKEFQSDLQGLKEALLLCAGSLVTSQTKRAE